jgi:hypothetical protein
MDGIEYVAQKGQRGATLPTIVAHTMLGASTYV